MKQNVTVAIIVYGKVQGVGFRPLVCRLAKDNKLTGFVRNAGTHVE
ncbi:MAG: acylphosphatase, partial [Acidaminococcaceae bacterium]|nr:acylphosphatase [Acidaminococcaceae bacterium]